MLMDFLLRIVKVFGDYFNVVNEESIKDNFVTVYELLDETIDFGLPQVTESSLLKDFIQIKHSKINEFEKVYNEKGILATVFKVNLEVNKIGQMTIKEAFNKITDSTKDSSKELRVPTAITNAISWRKEGIYYPENKVYLDVIEQINLICGSNGKTIHSEIIGTIKVNCRLSEMPGIQLF
jgi:AP-1 complex subunit mu